MADIFPLPCVSFIEMVEQTHKFLGTATSTILRDIGKSLGQATATLEELQGPAEEVKSGVFIQRKCPFADVVAIYKGQGLEIPPSVKKIAADAPQFGTVWVSAYCAVHQSLRQSKNPKIFQIACKAGDGSFKFAANDTLSEEEVKVLLKDAACVYGVAS